MKKVLMCFFMWCFTLSASALADTPKNKIIGAFGLKLGDKFELTAEMKKELASGDNEFSFEPPKAVRNLEYYFVRITPTTKNIYEIFAIQRLKDEKQCTRELDVFRHHLINKYGEFTKEELALDPKYYLINGNKVIVLKCDHSVRQSYLSVGYVDLNLQKLADEERIQTELNTSDMGGL